MSSYRLMIYRLEGLIDEARSSLIQFACIGVPPLRAAGKRPAAQTVEGEQPQCRQNGSDLI